MVAPSFLYIGPDKAGSSWMFNVLSAHPECYVPEAKDLYFFDRHYDRGIGWYLSQFEAGSESVAVGELSHDYLFSVPAATRIFECFPSVKLIASLRNPINRSLSHYQYLRRSGEVPVGFWDAIEKRPDIVSNSKYFMHLEPYLELFPRSQLSLLLFDDLERDPESFGRQLLDSIGLQPVPGLPFGERVRAAEAARFAPLARTGKALANGLRQVGAVNLLGRLKRSRASQLLYRPLGEDERPSLSADERIRLWTSEFQDDVERLSGVVDFNLSSWEPEGI